MAQRDRPRPTALEVQVMFEPSRQADACQADAYARIVPVRRRGLHPTAPTGAIPAAAGSTGHHAGALRRHGGG
jgi:hypothetical protein